MIVQIKKNEAKFDSFFATVTYGFYRYRINELIKRQTIRNKIAQDLHDSVGSTLSSVSVYSQVAKIQQAKGNLEELNKVIQKIATASTDMITEMNDIVWAINPRNDSMEKILQRMESFAKPLLQTQNINFSFSYAPALLNINLSMEQRKNFYLVFKEAVNNEAVIKIKREFPNIQILMQTVFEDDDRVFDSICSGASGYILKNHLNTKLIDAINELQFGGSPMSPSIARKVLGKLQKHSGDTLPQEAPDYQLTPSGKGVLA